MDNHTMIVEPRLSDEEFKELSRRFDDMYVERVENCTVIRMTKPTTEPNDHKPLPGR